MRHRTVDAGEIDALLAAGLRGDAPAWPWPSGGDEGVLRRVRYHGVAALLAERLRDGTDWPPALVQAIRDEARLAAMWEQRHQQVLMELLAALGRGIRPLLLKGTALAYDLYANPVWRLRADTDRLVAAGDLDGTRDVLLALGFARDLDAGGEVLTQQEGWTRLAGDGSRHARRRGHGGPAALPPRALPAAGWLHARQIRGGAVHLAALALRPPCRRGRAEAAVSWRPWI